MPDYIILEDSNLNVAEQVNVLFKSSLGFPSTKESTPWFQETSVKYNNYVNGEEILLDEIPSNPSFSVTPNLGNNGFDGQLATDGYIIEDSTRVIRQYHRLILTPVPNSSNNSYYALDSEGNNILTDGLQFNTKWSGSGNKIYPYTLYTQAFISADSNAPNELGQDSTGGNWLYDLKNGVIFFPDYNSNLCNGTTNKPVFSFFKYVGRKGIAKQLSVVDNDLGAGESNQIVVKKSNNTIHRFDSIKNDWVSIGGGGGNITDQANTIIELEGNLNKMTTMVANSTRITLGKASEVENDKKMVTQMRNEVHEYSKFNNDIVISNTELISTVEKINEKTLGLYNDSVGINSSVTNMKNQVIDFYQTNSDASITTSNLIQTAEKINEKTLGLYNDSVGINSSVTNMKNQVIDFYQTNSDASITTSNLIQTAEKINEKTLELYTNTKGVMSGVGSGAPISELNYVVRYRNHETSVEIKALNLFTYFKKYREHIRTNRLWFEKHNFANKNKNDKTNYLQVILKKIIILLNQNYHFGLATDKSIKTLQQDINNTFVFESDHNSLQYKYLIYLDLNLINNEYLFLQSLLLVFNLKNDNNFKFNFIEEFNNVSDDVVGVTNNINDLTHIAETDDEIRKLYYSNLFTDIYN